MTLTLRVPIRIPNRVPRVGKFKGTLMGNSCQAPKYALVQLCRQKLESDPFSGCLFLFRSRSATAIKILVYDSQGFWIAQKRLSKGRFKWWPEGSEASQSLEAHQAQILLAAGDPSVQGAPVWRPVK